MNIGRIALFAIGCLGAAVCANAQGITTHKVADGIYMLEGRGGNIGVSVGEDGVIVIDTQFANMADPVRAAIRELSRKDIEFIINTHFHFDHVGGNEALGQDAPVIAHENVRKRLTKGKDLSDDAFRNSLPWVTFDDDLSLHFNGEEIKVVHYPTGHTDTDCVIFFTESNVVHMGDHFINAHFPFIDLVAGGDVESYLNNVRQIIARLPADVKVIPGHGTLDDLKAFEKLLDETIGIVRRGIELGKDKQRLQSEGLPEKYDEAGSGFVPTSRWISTVYDSLTR